MNKKLLQLTLSAGITVSILLLGPGCANTGRVGPGPEIATPPSPEEEAEDAAEDARAETAVGQLNVAVSSETGGDEETKTVAERVDNRVQSRLTSSGFKISEEAPDLRVALGVDTDLFDKLGTTYRYKGEVRAEVQRLFDGQLLGRESFSLEGEREHSRDDALKTLADEMADNAGDWLVDTCTDGAAGVKVENVIVTRSHLLDRKDSEYADTFVRTVQEIDGVASCQLAEHNYEERRMVFRVVYFTDKLPAGLLNRLVTIDDLDMKPAQ